MKKILLAVAATLMVGTASAAVPIFAAKCGQNINVDSDAKGHVRVNGKVAKLIKRPDGQITAQSGGVYVDITPQGNEAPRVTYTGKDKSTGTCEILGFAPPAGHTAAAAPSGGHRASSSERAGQGQFDARGPVRCAMRAGQAMGECQAAVARDAGGTATIVITRPDGRKRFVFFENGNPVSADLSQADGNMEFSASKGGDVYYIQAGNERYEIVEAFIFGG
ncbi:hypothetical protein [Aeromonas sp. R6-2]|uniref:hypothetical protein n=1 Tax=unclassified Aeromonas TaxID=257493 RepID=UPI0034A16771